MKVDRRWIIMAMKKRERVTRSRTNSRIDELRKFIGEIESRIKARAIKQQFSRLEVSVGKYRESLNDTRIRVCDKNGASQHIEE
jgi:hypothetical protein